MSSELGKASLDLEANLTEFRRNVDEGKGSAQGLERALDALASVAEVAQRAVNDVRMGAGQAAESRASAEEILSGVRGVSEEAIAAARELDRVRLTETQAAESKIAAEEISGGLNQVSRNARQATRDLTEVRLAGGRNGVGVGIFGSGYGRVGAMGTAIGAGVLTTPVLGPATLGLLAALPVMAGAGAGALGTLALAFSGVSKAIEGDKQAYDRLQPAQQQFVDEVRSLSGELNRLKETAAAAVFPGLEKGLEAALSPGTLREINTAVEDFGTAIGQAGEQWGRYFGSPEFQKTFGPLMAEGAKDLGLASEAALRLFDAVGQLAKAGIPLTDWLFTAANDGAKLADSWIHAKEASGELSGAMQTAKTDLELVGHLAGALVSVVFSLGAALHPVSQVAVKDLTDGLDALAKIIHDNQGEIRSIVGELLNDLVKAVKLASGGIHELDKVTGGFKNTLELLLAIKVASTVAGWTSGLEKLIGANGAGLTGAAGEAETLRTKLGGLAKIGAIAIGIDLIVREHGSSSALGVLSTIGGGALAGAGVAGPYGALAGASLATGYEIGQGINHLLGRDKKPQTFADAHAAAVAQSVGSQLKSPLDNLANGVTAYDVANGSPLAGLPAAFAVAAQAAHDAAKRTTPRHTTPTTPSPFGADPAFTKNLGAKGSQPTGAALLSEALRNAIQHAKDEAAQSQGTVALGWLKAEQTSLEQAKKQLQAELDKGGLSAKAEAAIKNELRSLDNQIATLPALTGCRLIPLPKRPRVETPQPAVAA